MRTSTCHVPAAGVATVQFSALPERFERQS